MTSNLAITYQTNPATSTKAPPSSAGADTAATGQTSPFAALLDMVNAAKEAAPAVAQPGDLLEAGIHPRMPGDGETDLLGDLVDLLAAVDVSVAANQPVDPAVLAKLGATIDALSAVLGIDLTALAATGAATDPLAAVTDVIAGKAAAAAGADGWGAEAKAQVAPNAFAEKLAALATAVAPQAPDIAAKLEALAQKLGTTTVSADALARLGIDADLQPADTDLDAAITALLATKTEAKQPPGNPTIGTATLELPGIVKRDAGTLKDIEPSTRTPLAADAEPAIATETRDSKTAGQAATADIKIAVDTKPAVQAAVAAVVATTKETSVDPAQTAQPGPAVVRTDLGVGARAVHAAYQAPHTQINLPQLAFEIVRHATDGQSRFQIRLDPAELGRIDVKLDMDGTGGINAKLTVERAETLDLLQRDQRSLEKALAQAGLDSSKTNLEFSLKQNPFLPQGDGNGRNGSPFAQGPDEVAADAEVVQVSSYRGAATAGGVNIFV